LRFLVTGAAGFIGYHMALKLSENPMNTVYAVDNFQRRQPDQFYIQMCARDNVLRLDLDISVSAEDLPEVDYVIHLASLNGTENFYTRPFDVVSAAIMPTIALLRRYEGKNLKGFILSSTSETYAGAIDEFGWEVPTSENVPQVIPDITELRWSYAAGKIAAEAACVAANSQFGTPTQIVRYHNIYGPRMGDKHFIPEYIVRAGCGKFELHGSTNTRAFMYVEDAVDATLLVLMADLQSAPGTSVTHVGNNEEISILEVAKEMNALLGLSEIEILEHPAPKGSVSRRSPNVSKLTATYGFEPKFSRNEGLLRTIAYYKQFSQ